MMHSRAVQIAAALLVMSALPAGAQSQSPVSIKFDNGNVTIVARDAPVRTILAEWSRVGGSKIVNGDRVGGAPVTLELTNVPERQALAVLLRNVSGYAAAARPVPSTGSSSLDRILVLPAPPPVQTATSNTNVRPTPTPQPQQPVRFIGGDPDEAAELFLGTGGQPTVVRTGQVPTATTRDPVNVPRVIEDDQQSQPRQPAPATTPGFSGPIPGSSRPGEITPVPQQQQQQRNQPNAQ